MYNGMIMGGWVGGALKKRELCAANGAIIRE